MRLALGPVCFLLVAMALTALAAATVPPATADAGDEDPPPATRTPTATATLKPTMTTATATATTPGGTSPTATPTVPALQITTTSMPDGNIGTDYTAFITSNGGMGTPHMFSIISGSLPNGLSMAGSYGVQSTVVSGRPSTIQTTTFTVQVRDGTGHTATRTFSITVNSARTLVITNQSSTLAPGTVGSSYAIGLFADGGTQPYTWAITAGQLPPGLSLHGNIIQGTPSSAGTYTFTARVSDSAGQQTSQQFSITVS